MERGGVWIVVQNLLTLAGLLLAPRFPGVGRGAVTLVAGGALIAAGGGIGLAGVWALGRNLTAYPQPADGSNLVQHGIYGRMRHPLYSSLLLVALGWALVWWSGPALVAGLLLAAVLEAKVRREERWLRQKFPGYTDYADRVRRWWPRLR